MSKKQGAKSVSKGLTPIQKHDIQLRKEIRDEHGKRIGRRVIQRVRPRGTQDKRGPKT